MELIISAAGSLAILFSILWVIWRMASYALGRAHDIIPSFHCPRCGETTLGLDNHRHLWCSYCKYVEAIDGANFRKGSASNSRPGS